MDVEIYKELMLRTIEKEIKKRNGKTPPIVVSITATIGSIKNDVKCSIPVSDQFKMKDFSSSDWVCGSFCCCFF